MKDEPVVIVNTVTALIEAGIVMAVGFGLDLSTEQVASIMGFVLAVGVAIQTLLARARVTPWEKEEEEEE